MPVSRVVDLLLLWEDRVARGEPAAPADLCRDCPELEADLRRAIADLERVDDALRTTDDAGKTIPPAEDGESAAGLPTIPNFEVLGELGRGGMGVVYKARQVSLNRVVALKMILAGGLAGSDNKARFLAEAEAVAALQHPGIVQVYEFGTHDGLPYFALEFCPGDSLARKLAGTPLPPVEAAALVERLARAMHVAHQAGVVHRDLKPGNVLLAADGTPKVADFGLAKRIEGGEQLTQSGAIVGTPSYMAPEQANASKDVGPPADVYALGAILYECLTGRPPFKAATPLDTVLQVISEEPVPVRRLNRPVPADLETICHKCLQKDPAKRYASAAALADDLGRWQRGEPIAARPVGQLERGWRWCRRNQALAGSLGAVVAVVVIGLVGLAVGLAAVTHEQVATAAERDRANHERDIARAQKRRTREALDAMISSDMVERLGAQKELTKGQREFLQKALGYYREFAAEAATDDEGQALEARANFRVGYLFQGLGQKEEAISAYRSAIPIYEKLVDHFPNVVTYRHELAHSLNNLGLQLTELVKLGDAEAAYRAALAIHDKLVTDFPAVPAYRADLARHYSCLAGLLVTIGKYADAEVAFRKAIGLLERLVANTAAVPEYRKVLADTQNSLGLMLAGLRRRTEAETAYREALSNQEKLVDDFPTNPAYQKRLADGHNNLGLLLCDLGKPEQAEAAYRKALSIQKKLVTYFPADPAYRQNLAGSYNNLGILLNGRDRVSEAKAAYRAVLEIREKLTTVYPNVQAYQITLGGSYCNFGYLVRTRDDPQAALEWFAKAIERLRPVVDREPRLVEARKFLRNAHSGRAQSLVGLQRFAEALKDWNAALTLDDGSDRNQLRLGRADCVARLGRVASLEKRADVVAAYRTALAEQEKLAADFPAVPEHRQDLGQIHHELGILLTESGDKSRAAAAYRAAVAVRQKLVADFPAVPAYQNDLASSQNYLGQVLAGLGKNAEAEAAYRAALAIRERLAADFPAVPNHRRDLAQVCTNLAWLIKDLGKQAEAEALCRRTLALRERLAADFPAVPDHRRDLAHTHHDLSILLTRQGKRAEAEAECRAAVDLLTKLAADHPDVPDYRQRLESTSVSLSTVLVGAGKVSEAVVMAGHVADAKAPSAGALYDCARVFALAAAAPNNPDANRHAARAVVLLRRAFAAGFTNVAHMLKDSDLDPLRRRADYADFLWDLADTPTLPAKPPQ